MKIIRDTMMLQRQLKWAACGMFSGIMMLMLQPTSWAAQESHVVVPARCFPLDERPIERLGDGSLLPWESEGAEIVCPLVRDVTGSSQLGGRIYAINTSGDGIDPACTLWSCSVPDNQGNPTSCSSRFASSTGSGAGWLQFPNMVQNPDYQIFLTCEFGFNDVLSAIVYWEIW